jgi:hypothetical protein
LAAALGGAASLGCRRRGLCRRKAKTTPPLDACAARQILRLLFPLLQVVLRNQV